jgi:hypothetical protein
LAPLDQSAVQVTGLSSPQLRQLLVTEHREDAEPAQRLQTTLSQLTTVAAELRQATGQVPLIMLDIDQLAEPLKASAELRAVFHSFLKSTASQEQAKLVMVSNKGHASLLESEAASTDYLIRYFGVVDVKDAAADEYLQQRLQPTPVEMETTDAALPTEEADATASQQQELAQRKTRIVQAIGTRFTALHRVSERILAEDMSVEQAIEEEMRLPTIRVLKELRSQEEVANTLWQVIKIFNITGSATDGPDAVRVVPYSQLLAASPFQGDKKKLDAFLQRYENIFFLYGTGLPVGARVGSLDERGARSAPRPLRTDNTNHSVAALELGGFIGFADPVYKSVFERLRQDEDVQREMWQKSRRR